MPKTKPSDESSEAASPLPGQTRATLARFRLQVDRQTKAAFATLSEAENAGQQINKAYPLAQVSIYDAEDSRQALLG